jgi:hypothetical protein
VFFLKLSLIKYRLLIQYTVDNVGLKKSTYYDNWGPNGVWSVAAKGTTKITKFFPRISENNVEREEVDAADDQDVDSGENTTENSSDEADLWDDSVIENSIIELKKNLIDNQNTLSAANYINLRAIYEYLVRLEKGGSQKMKASLAAANAVFLKNGAYRARYIRYLANFWLRHNTLPTSRRGMHQKTIRLIDDEGIAQQCRSWIRKEGGKNGITPIQFKTFIETVLLPQIGVYKKKTISLETARRWLNVLGFFYQRHRKGLYFDGHEREDVVQYRDTFLSRMAEYERRMTKYEGDDMITEIKPSLAPGEKEIIFITHDECIFYSNDGKRGVWAPHGELPLRSKSNGRAIMVSDFLTEACGRLKLTPEEIQANPHVPTDARCILKPGKNAEGYWTVEKLLEQIEYRVLPIFEAKFPNAVALFAFDNSTNHSAFLPDALVASRMNKGPGGTQPKMRPTFWGPNHTKQFMVWPNNHHDLQLRGKPKGIEQVLRERGLWKPGLLLKCTLCIEKVENPARVDCCCLRIMSLQPDFMAQKSGIEEVIEQAGHLCIFYPKFHCECNFIEMYWGAAKRYTREHCDYSWNGLQTVLDVALDSVDLPIIRRFARKSFRYMDLYRQGITGNLAEYACKKFRSHRRIPSYALQSFLAEIHEK